MQRSVGALVVPNVEGPPRWAGLRRFSASPHHPQFGGGGGTRLGCNSPTGGIVEADGCKGGKGGEGGGGSGAAGGVLTGGSGCIGAAGGALTGGSGCIPLGGSGSSIVTPVCDTGRDGAGRTFGGGGIIMRLDPSLGILLSQPGLGLSDFTLSGDPPVGDRWD